MPPISNLYPNSSNYSSPQSESTEVTLVSKAFVFDKTNGIVKAFLSSKDSLPGKTTYEITINGSQIFPNICFLDTVNFLFKKVNRPIEGDCFKVVAVDNKYKVTYYINPKQNNTVVDFQSKKLTLPQTNSFDL